MDQLSLMLFMIYLVWNDKWCNCVSSSIDLTEIAECSREFCEQCHRTYPDVTDVKMALADIGRFVYVYLC